LAYTNVPPNFLPFFQPSDDLGSDLKSIKISEALSLGWYKGQIDYHMRKAGAIRNINGVEYYTGMSLGRQTNDFFNEGTTGYHQAEVLRLIGFQDSDLRELQKTWDNDAVDGMYAEWRASQEHDVGTFRVYMDNLRQDLFR